MAAQQPLNEQSVKWKPGTLCDLYVREQRKWAEGEVIGSFTDEHGEWVKVRCGPETHDVLCDDPYLRARGHQLRVIPAENIPKLNQLTAEHPVIGRQFERLLPLSSPSIR